MTTRICIRLNDQEQAAFAKIKGRLNDAEGFRMLLKSASDYAELHPVLLKKIKKDKTIKSIARDGRHIGKKKPANY